MSNRILALFILASAIGVGYIWYMSTYVPAKLLEDQKAAQAQIEQQKNDREEKFVLKKVENLQPIDISTENISEEKIWENILTLEKNNNTFILEKKDATLELFLSKENKKTFIGAFWYDSLEGIEIQEIYGKQNVFLFVFWNTSYLIDLEYNNLEKLELQIPIEYVKYMNNTYIITTQKGSFTYDLQTKKTEYFVLFHDFIYYNDIYIGIIQKQDARRLKNLWLWEVSEDIVVAFDPIEKSKKILESLEGIETIYINQKNEIIVSTSQNNFILKK